MQNNAHRGQAAAGCRGMSFADYLILIGIILLLGALAFPFVHPGRRLSMEDITGTVATNAAPAGATNAVVATNAPAIPRR